MRGHHAGLWIALLVVLGAGAAAQPGRELRAGAPGGGAERIEERGAAAADAPRNSTPAPVAPGQLRVEGGLGPVVRLHPERAFTIAWHLAGPESLLATLHMASFDPGPAGPSMCDQPSFEILAGPVGRAPIQPPTGFAVGDRRWIWVCAKEPNGRIVGLTNAVLIEGSLDASGTRTRAEDFEVTGAGPLGRAG